MKRLFVCLIFLIASRNVYAESILSVQSLQLGDSTRLFESLLNLGQSVETDAGDSTLVIRKTGFSTEDGAFIISCQNKSRIGIDLGFNCEIAIDSNQSKSNVTKVVIGAIGGVIVVNLFAAQDVKAIKQSVVSPLGYFQSVEKVQVRLLNGSIGVFPRLQIDCKTNPKNCQILYLP